MQQLTLFICTLELNNTEMWRHACIAGNRYGADRQVALLLIAACRTKTAVLAGTACCIVTGIFSWNTSRKLTFLDGAGASGALRAGVGLYALATACLTAIET